MKVFVRDQVVKVSEGWLALCNGEVLCVCDGRMEAINRMRAHRAELEAKADSAARAVRDLQNKAEFL